MKARTGFVSNSSTSSFICSICGGIEAGMDAGLYDFEMFECKEGHVAHYACAKLPPEALEEDQYEVSPEHCPVCQLKIIEDHTLVTFLLQKMGMSKDEACDEIRQEYTTLQNLRILK